LDKWHRVIGAYGGNDCKSALAGELALAINASLLVLPNILVSFAIQFCQNTLK